MGELKDLELKINFNLKSMNMIRFMIMIVSILTSYSCSKDDPAPGISDRGFDVFFVQQYSVDAMGFAYSYFQDYMLLKDGTILYDVKQAYEEVDVAEFRQKNPKKVGTWEKEGNHLIVKFGVKESVWESWYEGIPAQKGETLNATYKSLFSTAIRRVQHLTFRPDGTYTFTDRSDNIVQSGNYRLEGFGLYLTSEAGASQSYSFLFMPKNGKKDTKGLIVNNDNWVVSD